MGGGVLIKEPKRKSFWGSFLQSGTEGIQAEFKWNSSEKARIHLSCNILGIGHSTYVWFSITTQTSLKQLCWIRGSNHSHIIAAQLCKRLFRKASNFGLRHYSESYSNSCLYATILQVLRQERRTLLHIFWGHTRLQDFPINQFSTREFNTRGLDRTKC